MTKQWLVVEFVNGLRNWTYHFEDKEAAEKSMTAFQLAYPWRTYELRPPVTA